ncbi:MAG: VRR-NUC domain-containing protein [Peptococcaceae bacterium]|nr:MAG: VRR-NUC domain-containing protein [Peptococcaceae bacterium]
MNEHSIQNLIRLELAKLGVITFRANVGEAWTGDSIKHNPDGSITIYRPRRFKTGLPPGFSDLFGVAVGGGRAVFIEVKSKTGRLRPEQENFLAQMARAGALAGVARNPEEAKKILSGNSREEINR